MTTVAFQTLGCKVNFYDSEGIWQLFKARGYEQVPFETVADVYVINTCTVTGTGDKKSRQAIRRAVRNNGDATVVVTGCYAQVAPAEVAAIHGVDLVVGNDRKAQIVDLVEIQQRDSQPLQSIGNILKTREFEELDVPMFEDRTRANLKIQDGCNNFCTFCIIPYARGLIRSRKPEQIIAQAHKLTKAGYREIVLTGIHTGGYGADLTNYRLANLLRALEQVNDLYRVRISSIEASEIDDELIEVLGQSTKVCHHLHIPLQAGHDEVLRRMNRHYRVADFASKLDRLREALPNLSITSDVIVGFPGETDEYFAATESFIAEQRFSQLHVFPYSARKGTPAARFVDVVADDVKEQRVSRLLDLSQQLTVQYATGFLEETVDVIAEGPMHITGCKPGEGPAPGFWLEGHADNYLKVAFPINEHQSSEHMHGEVCRVRVNSVSASRQMATFQSQLTFTDEGFGEVDGNAS